MKILMLGNSFTFYNDMPVILADILGAEVRFHAMGGANLIDHLNPAHEMGAKTLSALENEKWDYVVLQEMSCGPITEQKNFEIAVKSLTDLAKANGAKAILYSTWAYKEGSEEMNNFRLGYKEMYEALSTAYRFMAWETDSLLAEVGKRFFELSENENLYNEDGAHPNEKGSMIAAQEIARTILRAEREKDEVVSASQMKEIERQIDAAGISYYQMMENAGTNAYKRVRELFPDRHEFIIFIGKGNNGGDGLVAARLALLDDFNVYLVKAEGEPVTTDAKKNYELLMELAGCQEPTGGCLDREEADKSEVFQDNNRDKAAKLGKFKIISPSMAYELPEASCTGCFVAIDAIYGTGFHGELRENGKVACQAINRLRNSGVPVVAFDIPSGVNGDSAQVSDGAVRADYTIAFHLRKHAHTVWDVSFYTGQVWTCGIGI